jgi:lipopolysaccharide heptosyltransferase II
MLKKHWPQSEIYWWIEAGLAPLIEADPDLAGLILFHRNGWTRPPWWRAMWTSIRTAREKRFDLVLDLQGLSRSALFGWLANGATFIGLDNLREGNREGAQIFYDRLASRSLPGTPAPERYVNILRALGLNLDWNFEWLPARTKEAALVRERLASRSGHWVMLLPGARWETKRWPAEFFAETVRQLGEADPSLNFAILGSAADSPSAKIICCSQPERCLDLTGQTRLPEMVEWLRCASLVISNDTGPLHVAAALALPLIAIYGPSDPSYTGPYLQAGAVLQNQHLSCVPCMKRVCAYHEPLACLRSIAPGHVFIRAQSLLSIQAALPPAREPASI